MSAVENFPTLLSEAEEESSAVPPCFSYEGINVRCPTPFIFCHIPLVWPPVLSLDAESRLVPLHSSQ